MRYKAWIIGALILLLLMIAGVVIVNKAFGQDKCKAEYPTGTIITLTVTACPNWTFIGWTGDCAKFGKGKVCTLVMNEDKVVGTKFLPTPKGLKISTLEEILYCSSGEQGYFSKGGI